MGDKEIDKETKGEVRPKDEKDEDILVVEIHDSAVSRAENQRDQPSQPIPSAQRWLGLQR